MTTEDWVKVDPADLPPLPLPDAVSTSSGDVPASFDSDRDDAASPSPEDDLHHPLSSDQLVPLGETAASASAIEILNPHEESVQIDADVDPVKRRQQLEHHLRNNPIDRDAFLELALLYRNDDKPGEAGRVLKRGLEVFPDDPKMQWDAEEAVLARSLQILREASELAKRFATPAAEHERGRAATDWAQRRIEVCRSRLARDPSLVQLNVILGEAYYDVEKYADAIEVLNRVTDHPRFSPVAYLLIGKCEAARGRFLESMSAFRGASMRRAIVAPPAVRTQALTALIETADRLGTPATKAIYESALASIRQTDPAPKPAPESTSESAATN